MVRPSARKLIAVPPTIWSARSVIEKNACSSPNSPPAHMPMSSPSVQVPVTSEPQTAKNAPLSIIPSSPMFTTPERSENRPPSDAKTSGVAYRSIAPKSAPQTTTASRFSTLERVARYPMTSPKTPAAAA